MNVSEWWQSLIVPDRWSVCGVSVRALSVWHLFALEQTENAFVIGGEITMDDVAGLLLICQTDYESGRSLFTRPHATRRRTAKIYRKLKRLTTDQAIGTALDYFASCTETPERWTEEKKGRGIAAPLCHHIVLCLCSQFNFAHVEAWNHRYCDARCMMEAWREREGDTSLLTPYQKQLVAEAERIKAAAQKETATT